MAITIEIPSALRRHSRGQPIVIIDTSNQPCGSVADALGALASQCPGVIDRVMTEQGELRPHVNVFADYENIRYTDGLDTPIGDPATITILAAISGG
ncbi:MAG: MoaD/ThiS family protein [Gemmatimonadaceae bacterium]